MYIFGLHKPPLTRDYKELKLNVFQFGPDHLRNIFCIPQWCKNVSIQDCLAVWEALTTLHEFFPEKTGLISAIEEQLQRREVELEEDNGMHRMALKIIMNDVWSTMLVTRKILVQSVYGYDLVCLCLEKLQHSTTYDLDELRQVLYFRLEAMKAEYEDRLLCVTSTLT